MSDYYTESQMQRIEQAAHDDAMLEAGKEWERQRYEFGATEAELGELAERVTELEAAQRWVPVSERLPEDRATVLVAFKNREILTATYYKRYEGFGGVENYWDIAGWHSGNVTHWMPLPQPPEDNYVGDSDHEHDDRIL